MRPIAQLTPAGKTEKVLQRLLDGAPQVIDQSGHPELVEQIIADIERAGGGYDGQASLYIATASASIWAHKILLLSC